MDAQGVVVMVMVSVTNEAAAAGGSSRRRSNESLPWVGGPFNSAHPRHFIFYAWPIESQPWHTVLQPILQIINHVDSGL